MHLMKGTPYVYQGEEIGMTNVTFERIDQFRDVETLGHYADAVEKGIDPADFIAGANTNGRDNARTPMQWAAETGAGFTTGTPWIDINPNHAAINVAADRADPGGMFEHYRKLIALRRELPVIVHGRYVPFAQDDPAVFAYARELDGARLAVVANFTGAEVAFEVPAGLSGEGTCLVGNVTPRERLAGTIRLAPYEAFAILLDAA